MNKSELIDSIAQHANLTKAEAGKALDGLIHSIENALKQGNGVALVGFGTFELKHRGERKGRNPQTGAEITIAATSVPSFKPGKALKEAVIGLD